MLNTRGNRSRIRIVAAVATAAALAAAWAVAAYAGGSQAPTRSAGSARLSGMTGTSSMPMPMPIRILSRTVWQGMRIEVRSMAPANFVIFSGSSERMVRVTKKDTIHLMVMLSDAGTGMRIPYASVWATIRKQGRIVFDERLWPMLARFMGSHYGNNVALPGNGTYVISLLISPPQAARHMEYAHVWMKPHRVTMTFRWTGM
jgi:Fe2+ transport protein